MKPVVLLILDGWGINRPWRGNAISRARTPNFLALAEHYPFFSLQASGIAVGLPWGEPGNSEVGHLTIGAGRVVMQYLPRITEAVFDGSFFKNEPLLAAARAARENQGRLHLAGLVSSGTVHASLEHLFGLLELARREGITDVYLHVFTDGMDGPRREARSLLPQLAERLARLGVGVVASLVGRRFAMDRTGNWRLTSEALKALLGETALRASSLTQALTLGQAKSGDDSDFPAITLVNKAGLPVGNLKSGDALVFFNFREDSMHQIAQALLEADFSAFPRPPLPALAQVVTFTEYDARLPAAVAFQPPKIQNTLAEVISRQGLKQLHVAEREKYAHITFFFNGWRKEALSGETQRVLDRPLQDHGTQPAMAAADIAGVIIEALRQNAYTFMAANFANADVLAHTGNLEATVAGIEALDEALGAVAKAASEKEALLVITADHGHAEEMLHPLTNEVLTEHTAYPVPLMVVQPALKQKRRALDWARKTREAEGVLTDVAPLTLSFLKIPQPEEMTGKALVDFSRGTISSL